MSNQTIQNIHQKEENVITVVDTLYLLFFLRDMHEGNLSLEDAHKEIQLATIQLANKLKDMP